MPNQHRGITVILLVAMVIRLGWAIVQPSTDAAMDRLPDQREYLSLGRNLLFGDSLSFVDPRFDQTVYAYRTPGYPAFAALWRANPRTIRIAQALLDTATVLAVYLLARRLSGDLRHALFAAAIIAINPFLIYFCGLILSETLFTAVLAWACVLFVRRQLIWAAVVMGVATLVRPSALALAPLLAVAAAFTNSTVGSAYPMLPMLRRAVGHAGLVMVIVLIALLPWAYRNHVQLGRWIWTTTNEGVTLYDGFNPAATGGSDQRFLTEMPQLRSMNEVERNDFLKSAARSWAQENAATLPGLTLRKIARTWSPVTLSANFGRPLYRTISAAYALPLDALVLLGLFTKVLSRRAKLLLLTPAIYFTIVHALSVGSLRYRVPVEPELTPIAAGAAVVLFNKTKLRTESITRLS